MLHPRDSLQSVSTCTYFKVSRHGWLEHSEFPLGTEGPVCVGGKERKGVLSHAHSTAPQHRGGAAAVALAVPVCLQGQEQTSHPLPLYEGS